MESVKNPCQPYRCGIGSLNDDHVIHRVMVEEEYINHVEDDLDDRCLSVWPYCPYCGREIDWKDLDAIRQYNIWIHDKE